MNWFKICSEYFSAGYYTNIDLKIFVVKNKITTDNYKAITGIDYVA